MDSKNSKKQILHNLVQIMDLCPQYSTSQHWIHILRRKGGKDPYTWTEEELLQKVENYYDEVLQDLVYDSKLPKEEDV